MQTSQKLVIKNILTEAVMRKAGDLHFSVGNKPVLRVDDKLEILESQDLITREFMEGLVDFLLDEKEKKELNDNREIIMTYDFDKNLRFKINIFYQRNFLSATLRYIPPQVPGLNALNLNPIIKDLTALKRGLIIVSGPFGSGRSTTMAAMVEEINQNRKEYIITIEDPIEYLFINQKSIIEQREIKRDTKSFVEALKYFEEEDGDVLFLEEMEDPAVMPIVLEIARGSALVITSLSAGSASETISRILDSFQSFDQERVRDLLATALKAVICQKIVPKIGGGVVIIQEIMTINEAIQAMIINGNVSQIDNIIQTSRREGMISFDQILADLVQAGKVSRTDALDNASDRKRLSNLIK